jgi:hypothetical protein
MTQNDNPIHPILHALDFTRYTDAKIGKAFEDALKALAQDMAAARYEPSPSAASFYSALSVCIHDTLEALSEIVTVPPETPKPSFDDIAVASLSAKDSDNVEGTEEL